MLAGESRHVPQTPHFTIGTMAYWRVEGPSCAIVSAALCKVSGGLTDFCSLLITYGTFTSRIAC